jgi:hypothetical protein
VNRERSTVNYYIVRAHEIRSVDQDDGEFKRKSNWLARELKADQRKATMQIAMREAA